MSRHALNLPSRRSSGKNFEICDLRHRQSRPELLATKRIPLYLGSVELEDCHMFGFKPSFPDELKLWWSSLARSSRQVYSAAIAVGIGATFIVALYYSLSYISQVMANAVMTSLYG